MRTTGKGQLRRLRRRVRTLERLAARQELFINQLTDRMGVMAMRLDDAADALAEARAALGFDAWTPQPGPYLAVKDGELVDAEADGYSG